MATRIGTTARNSAADAVAIAQVQKTASGGIQKVAQ